MTRHFCSGMPEPWTTHTQWVWLCSNISLLYKDKKSATFSTQAIQSVLTPDVKSFPNFSYQVIETMLKIYGSHIWYFKEMKQIGGNSPETGSFPFPSFLFRVSQLSTLNCHWCSNNWATLDPHSDKFSSGKMKEGYIQWCLGKCLTTAFFGGEDNY